MAKTKVSDWDTTAANNTDINAINIDEGWAAANMNNSIREMMAQIAVLAPPGAVNFNFTATTGSSDAYILTTGKYTALTNTLRLAIKASFDNTGACTIDLDGIGATDIKILDPTGIVDPVAGQIQNKGVYDLVYVSAAAYFVLLNPTPLSDVFYDKSPQLGAALDSNEFNINWSKGTSTASASNLLPPTDGNYFHITGTTTIDTINAVRNGATILVVFDDALTLTHSSTSLRLPGSADITTVAGDFAFFVQNISTQWRCVAYHRVSGKSAVETAQTKSSFFHIQEQQASGTSAGGFTAGAWQTRALNTSIANGITGASLATNQITLPAGTFAISGFAIGFGVDLHKAKLVNITDTTDVIIGSSERSNTTSIHATKSDFRAEITIAATKVFEVQHICSTTRATDGFGQAGGFSVIEVYADILIEKLP